MTLMEPRARGFPPAPEGQCRGCCLPCQALPLHPKPCQLPLPEAAPSFSSLLLPPQPLRGSPGADRAPQSILHPISPTKPPKRQSLGSPRTCVQAWAGSSCSEPMGKVQFWEPQIQHQDGQTPTICVDLNQLMQLHPSHPWLKSNQHVRAGLRPPAPPGPPRAKTPLSTTSPVPSPALLTAEGARPPQMAFKQNEPQTRF